MRDDENDLERRLPLVMELGLWVNILLMLALGAAFIGLPVYRLTGGPPELELLGVTWVVDADAFTVAMGCALGSLFVGFAIVLVLTCTSVPRLWRGTSRERAEPEPPAAAWRTDAPLPSAGEELLRVEGDVASVAFTADGSLLVAGAGGTQLWDVAAGDELLHIPEAAGVPALSPDGEHLATVRGSFGIVLRTLHGGDERTLVHRTSFWQSGAGGVTALAFAPDGERLVTAGDPDTRVWSVADGRELLSIPTGATEFHGVNVDVSPDGRFIATTTTSRETCVWDADDGTLVRQLKPAPQRYGRVTTAVAFSPVGRLLAALCADDTAWVWDTLDGRLLAHFQPAGRRPACFEPRALAWSPDGRRLVVPCADGSARVWDVAAGDEWLRVQHAIPARRPRAMRWSGLDLFFGVASAPSSVAVSGDGELLATGGAGVVRVWALA